MTWKDDEYKEWIDKLYKYFDKRLREKSDEEWEIQVDICGWDFKFVCRLGNFVRHTQSMWAGDFTEDKLKSLNDIGIYTVEDRIDLEVNMIISSREFFLKKYGNNVRDN